jgi:hypothetical protein
MRSLKVTLWQVLVGLLTLAVVWSQDTGSASINGHVQIGENTTQLIAHLYSPKSSIAQQNAQQGESAARRVRVAYVGADGRFQFPGLRSGTYLLEIYSGERLLYQKAVSTEDPQPLEIDLNAPRVFKQRDWRPGDMTADPTSGVFVLDSKGGVSRVYADQQSTHIDTLFRLKAAYQGYAVSASAESVYVAANSPLGCVIVKYTLANKAVAEKLPEARQQCAGIATNGTAIYVTMPQRNEIWVLESWEASSYRRWSVSGSQTLGSIVFDHFGNRLIVADHSGNAYGVSISDGASQSLASDLGWVNAIAAAEKHILVATGTKILSLARADNRGELPPPSLQSLTGGHIVGVAVDANDKAWFADWDKQLVEGALALN